MKKSKKNQKQPVGLFDVNFYRSPSGDRFTVSGVLPAQVCIDVQSSICQWARGYYTCFPTILPHPDGVPSMFFRLDVPLVEINKHLRYGLSPARFMHDLFFSALADVLFEPIY